MMLHSCSTEASCGPCIRSGAFLSASAGTSLPVSSSVSARRSCTSVGGTSARGGHLPSSWLSEASATGVRLVGLAPCRLDAAPATSNSTPWTDSKVCRLNTFKRQCPAGVAATLCCQCSKEEPHRRPLGLRHGRCWAGTPCCWFPHDPATVMGTGYPGRRTGSASAHEPDHNGL